MSDLIPDSIRTLHDAYLTAMGFEPEDLPLVEPFIRWYFDALKSGITPDGLRLAICERRKFNAKNQRQKSLELKRLIRDEEDIGVLLNEIAIIRARMRVKVMPSGRAEAMRTTGRVDEIPTEEAKHVASVGVIKAFDVIRNAAQ